MNTLYYTRCSWCTARPRVYSHQSVQLCYAPTGTKCSDMSSYKAATEVWWWSEDAMLSISSWFSEKKKKRTPTFPLVGRPAQVSYDHQRMARLEVKISEAALAIHQKSIARAGAHRSSAKSPEKKNTPSKSEEKVSRQMSVAKLNNFCNTFCKEELLGGLARAAETSVLLQTKNEKKRSSQIMSDQAIWFGRRRLSRQIIFNNKIIL